MKLDKPQYWSMFYYGSSKTICSEHRTLKAALRAGKECEHRGGAKHYVLQVKEVKGRT